MDNNICYTLFTGNKFYWRLENDMYFVLQNNDGPAKYKFPKTLYQTSLEFLFSQPNGTPLGAKGDGEVPTNSLGTVLKSAGKERPLASYLAAIAVAEGAIQYEHLGAGPGRGIRLFPVRDEPVQERIRMDDEVPIGTKQFIEPYSVAKASANALRQLADRVESSQASEDKLFEFNLGQLAENKSPPILNDVKDWEILTGTSRFIYRFLIEDSSTAKELKLCMADAKLSTNNKTKYSRINTVNSDSLCLYVGSSKSVAQRMKQHLGYAHPSVYSLHIKSWQNLPDSTIKIEIQKYPENIGQDVLQAIEDSLWQSSMPLFGKQGAR